MMFNFLRLLCCLLLLTAMHSAPALAGKSSRAPNYEAVTAAIAQLLQSPGRLPLPLERIRPALVAHYVRDGGTIYWVGTGRMTPFIQRLADAAGDGLSPDDYPIDSLIQLRDAVDPDGRDGAAAAELLFSAFFINYAADLRIGRLTPQKIDPRLFRNRKTIDVLRVLTELKKQREPAKFLSAFESRNPHYQALKKMLELYRAMAESGGWPVIGAGPNIEPRGNDARVQARHGLAAKGLVGKQTFLALNVPPAERARQIMLNMERWRWMPENLGDHHFMINLAAFELQEVVSLDTIGRMNVVVGAVATQTPEFSDEMEYVEINPTWTVPYSIATKEMLPKLKQNSFAYAAEFDVFVSGALATWGGIDWNAYGPGKFPFTFRQRPGPKNALGKVKFMLPNAHNIYLHDTPSKDKFLQTTRAFSHGCIRLSRPVDLAYRLVGEIAGWTKAKIGATFKAGKTARVPLPESIPVHLIYATAFDGANGVEFRPDFYGRDRKLYAALYGKPSS